MAISTSVWSAQHPNAGRNIQHLGQLDSYMNMKQNTTMLKYSAMLHLYFLKCVIKLMFSLLSFIGEKRLGEILARPNMEVYQSGIEIVTKLQEGSKGSIAVKDMLHTALLSF